MLASASYLYQGEDGVLKFPYRDETGEVRRELVLKARDEIQADPALHAHVRKRLLRRANNIAGFLLFGKKSGELFLEYKAASMTSGQGYTTSPSGIVTAYAGAFGNVDDGDDILEKGASLDSITDRMRDPERPQIRNLYGHMHDKVTGRPLRVVEDDYGILTETQYALKTFWGNEVFGLIEAKCIDLQSFGWLPGEDKPGQKAITYDDQGRRHLHRIDFYEYGALPFAMNGGARILMAKGAIDPQGPFVNLVEQAAAAINGVLLEAEEISIRKGKLTKAHQEALEAHVEDVRTAIAGIELLCKGSAEEAETRVDADEVKQSLISPLKLQLELARERMRYSGVEGVLP